MTEEVLPQISLTGSGADLDPGVVLAHALLQYQAGVRSEAEARVLAGPVDLGAEILQGILMEVAGGHLNLFRITAGVAFRVSIRHARARQLLSVTEIEAAKQADDAAMNLGAYLAATSSNAVMEGFNLNLNAKVPAKEAARRSVHAFGLTAPQMRSVFRLKDDGVKSASPGAWRSLIDRFIDRAFGQRIGALVDNSLRQVESDAIQRGWEDGLANGTIAVTAVKVWFTAADERTCPVCAPMDRVSVSILDSFQLPDGNKVKAPPVHVNCRCTVELRTEGEEFGKAKDWNPRLHPRSHDGEFAFKVKTKEVDQEALANVNRLLVGTNLNQVTGLSTTSPVAGPASTAPPRAAAGPRAAQGLRVNSPAAASAPGAETAGALRTHAVLGGQLVNLRRLSMTHQLQVAAVVAGNLEHQAGPALPENQVERMGSRYVAFSAPVELNVQRYNMAAGEGDIGGRWRGEMKGFVQIEKPLRFVDRNDRAAVRTALEEAMEDMDKMLREDPYDETIETMAQSSDPGVVEAAADLRMNIGAGARKPKGQVRVSTTPEDAMEAWRNILSPTGSGYRSGGYTIEAFDETGRTVGRAVVSASTIAALNDTQTHYRPHVVIAPYGTWATSSGRGATNQIPGTDHMHVTGPFHFERVNGVIVLSPDPGVYRRANPEHRPGD